MAGNWIKVLRSSLTKNQEPQRSRRTAGDRLLIDNPCQWSP